MQCTAHSNIHSILHVTIEFNFIIDSKTAESGGGDDVLAISGSFWRLFCFAARNGFWTILRTNEECQKNQEVPRLSPVLGQG